MASSLSALEYEQQQELNHVVNDTRAIPLPMRYIALTASLAIAPASKIKYRNHHSVVILLCIIELI